MPSTPHPHRPDTHAVHAGEPRPSPHGSVVTPIFQSAQFEFASDTSVGRSQYIRYNTVPNQKAVQDKLAALEGAEEALVTASGMAAISAMLLSQLKSGDHLLVQDCLYGGTHQFVNKTLPRLGIEHDVIDAARPDTWRSKLRPSTRVIYVETITNPLVQVTDLDAVSAFAREHKLVSMVDSTFASPVNCRPIEHGLDLVMHSATKYLNGHSDIVAGFVAGSLTHIEACRRTALLLGGCLDPHACFLLQRGMKTLFVRVERQNHNALILARFLAEHPAVERVNYPGLEENPGFTAAKRILTGPGAGFGGIVSFELKGGAPAAQAFLSRLRIPVHAGSLGGCESLVVRPAVGSHAALTPEERRRMGISDGLIRFSAGIESVEDLVDDLRSALATT